jgi:hypothetical protein
LEAVHRVLDCCRAVSSAYWLYFWHQTRQRAWGPGRMKVVEGDNNNYGTVYIGFATSGFTCRVLH